MSSPLVVVDWRQNGIPQLMMEFWIKQRKNEPLIVLTHSMEGQIVYDLVTHFLPRLNRICGIDSWYATASQVDLFEEMKLFLESSAQHFKAKGNKVPIPDQKYLGI